MKASSESGLCAIVIFVAIPNRRSCHTRPTERYHRRMLRLSWFSAAALAMAVVAPAGAQEPAPARAQEPAKVKLAMSLDAILPVLNSSVVRVRTPSEGQ